MAEDAITCPACQGSGQMRSRVCLWCQGGGSLTVYTPAQIGAVLRRYGYQSFYDRETETYRTLDDLPARLAAQAPRWLVPPGMQGYIQGWVRDGDDPHREGYTPTTIAPGASAKPGRAAR